MKNRLGRIPRLVDFYENEEIDPMIIIREYKTYYAMLKAMEKEQEIEKLSDSETLILEYLSKNDFKRGTSTRVRIIENAVGV